MTTTTTTTTITTTTTTTTVTTMTAPEPTKSVTKQLYINRLQTPEDLQLLIKDFCFYDTKSWDTMQHIKSRKNRINHLLNKSCISRANPEEFYYFGANEDEHWTFWVYNEEDGDDLQMQSVNCSKCGNYKMSFNIPEKIRCNCTNHNMTIHDIDIDDNSDNDSDYIPEGFGIDPDFEYTSDYDDSYDE